MARATAPAAPTISAPAGAADNAPKSRVIPPSTSCAGTPAMLERLLKYFLLAAIATGPMSGCAYMTHNGRQQMAYQRYIRKQSGRKMQIAKKVKSPKVPKTPRPTENKPTLDVIETPQSVTSGESQSQPIGENPSPQ